MEIVVPLLKNLLLFILTGLSLFRMAPRAIREIHSWTDRILLSLLTGIAFYTLFFLLAMGLMGLPLTPTTLWGTFLIILAAGTGVELYRRRRHQRTGFEESAVEEESETLPPNVEKRFLREALIFGALALIFFLSLNTRLQNGLRYPDKLLDADPYRHHIRTEALLETGQLSKFDPYLVGEVPIFELQGCYILAGVLGGAGPFSAWQIWMWGSQVFGALSIVSLYLFTKLALRDVLHEDLGPPKRKGKKGPPLPHLTAETAATFVGLIAACLLGASPVHILRTNAGFSEAFAIPMLAPTLLFYLWAAQSRIWGDFVWFGVFFSALAFINPVPAVFTVPFFAVHALYVFSKTKDRRWLVGIGIAGGIFAACLLVWNWKFLATPLFTGVKATSEAGTEGILKSMGKNVSFFQKLAAGWATFSKEVFKNLGFFNPLGKFSRFLFSPLTFLGVRQQWFYDLLTILGGFIGSVWILWNRREKAWRINITSVFFFLSYVFFFLILFLIPFGFISFTSKYYRYLLPISLSISFLNAYFVWRVVLLVSDHYRRRIVLLAFLLMLALGVNADGRTWGGWVLNCTAEEYAAADWINKNTQAGDFIIANWYTGDYLRSLTKRRVIISDYPRVEVKVAKDKYDLKIPILPKDPFKVWDYVVAHPGTYYLVVAKWGPGGPYEQNPHFELLQVFGKDKKTQAKVFRIVEESAESQPANP